MPQTFQITAPDGRVLRITGDQPPTESELNDIFAASGGAGFKSSNEKDAQGNAVVRLAAPMPKEGEIAPDVAAGLRQAATATSADDDTFRSGVAKEVMGVFGGAGHLASHLIPGVSRIAQALTGLTPDQQEAAFGEWEKLMEAKGLMGKAGKAAMQVAETIIPSGAIEKAGATVAAKVAPKIAPLVGNVVAQLAPKAAVEGAGMAALSAAQGGNPVAGGVLGAASPVVARAIMPSAESLQASASKDVMQALGPTKERFKAIAERLTPEILKRGLGGSREALKAQSSSTLASVGSDLDALLLTKSAQHVKTQPVIDALESAKDAFRVTNNANEVVVLDGRAIRQLDALQNTVSQLGNTATVPQLVAVRRAWDRVVDQAGGYAQRATGAIGVPLKDQSEAWAKREGSSAIRELLANETPDLAAINKEYAFWKGLDDVLKQTLKRTQPQKPGIGSVLAEAGGQMAGAVAASPAGPAATFGAAALAGKAAALARTVFESPRWKFISAQMKNDLADAIASGTPQKVTNALSRIAAVQGSQAFRSATP